MIDNNNELVVLKKLIDRISVIGSFSNSIGLRDGKTGVLILLYYYSQLTDDNRINIYADKYLNVISENITDRDNKEISEIAWAINNLIELKFVEADMDVFEEIDAKLFESDEKDKKLLFRISSEIWSLGLYIHCRLRTADIEKISFWQGRMKIYFQTVLKLFAQRYLNNRLPVFDCKDLSCLLSICVKLQNENWCKQEINSIYKELPLFLEIALMEESISVNKYLLSAILVETSIKINHLYLGNEFAFASLTDVNQFFFNRFILDLDIKIPDIIGKTIQSIIYDDKRIDSLLFMLNPNNAGIENYVSGLAWAILQWCIEKNKTIG